MILKAIRRRPFHSSISVIVITLGMAIVTMLNCFVEVLVQKYPYVLRDPSSHDLIVTEASVPDIIHSNLEQSLQRRIESVAGVERVEPGIFFRSRVGSLGLFPLYGYQPASAAMRHFRITAGEPVTETKQIALGHRAATALRKKVNDSLRFFGTDYKIVGIYETGQSVEELGGVVSLEDAQRILNKEQAVSFFRVSLRADADAWRVTEQLDLIDDVAVSKLSEWDINQQYVRSLKVMVWGMAAIISLIGGLWLMIGLVKGVFARAPDFARWQRAEHDRWQAWRVVLSEAMLLSMTGAFIGLVMSIGLVKLAQRKHPLGIFLEDIFSGDLFLPSLLTALSIGLIGGLYPAWRASRMLRDAARAGDESARASAASHEPAEDARALISLWQRPTRTALALSLVGLCIAVPLMLGGVTKGLIYQLNNILSRGASDQLIIAQRDAPGLSVNTLDAGLASRIRTIPQVKSVSPLLVEATKLQGEHRFLTLGLSPDDPTFNQLKLLEGAPLNHPGDILIGKKAAQNRLIQVGQSVMLNRESYKVAGIFETGVLWEDQGGLMTLEDAQHLMAKPNTVSFILVKLHNPTDAESVIQSIERSFPATRVRLRSDFAQNNMDIKELSSTSGKAQMLSLIIAGLVLTNLLAIAVYEGRRARRTTQATRHWWRLRAMRDVAQEGLTLCLLSMLAGSLIAVGLLWLITQQPAIGAFIEARWELQVFLKALGLSMVIGLLGSAYPMWLASRLRPAQMDDASPYIAGIVDRREVN
ncbi:MAG: ABC transporter permease [Pyrinomonadaceae bacterium]